MSKTYIPVILRRQITEAADNCCEYCRVPRAVAFASYHIDHIISEKQGGKTVFSNLALACRLCNLSKGSSIAAYHEYKEALIRLYNPRKDRWTAHFYFRSSGMIVPRTEIGQGTIKVLNLNDLNRVDVRRVLIGRGIIEVE
ncbi:MAG: HNH endonuclease signature motif containing protein [Bacteroidota bacterium]